MILSFLVFSYHASVFIVFFLPGSHALQYVLYHKLCTHEVQLNLFSDFPLIKDTEFYGSTKKKKQNKLEHVTDIIPKSNKIISKIESTQCHVGQYEISGIFKYTNVFFEGH